MYKTNWGKCTLGTGGAALGGSFGGVATGAGYGAIGGVSAGTGGAAASCFD